MILHTRSFDMGLLGGRVQDQLGERCLTVWFRRKGRHRILFQATNHRTLIPSFVSQWGWRGGVLGWDGFCQSLRIWGSGVRRQEHSRSPGKISSMGREAVTCFVGSLASLADVHYCLTSFPLRGFITWFFILDTSIEKWSLCYLPLNTAVLTPALDDTV